MSVKQIPAAEESELRALARFEPAVHSIAAKIPRRCSSLTQRVQIHVTELREDDRVLKFADRRIASA
jgi:hypothetical protein